MKALVYIVPGGGKATLLKFLTRILNTHHSLNSHSLMPVGEKRSQNMCYDIKTAKTNVTDHQSYLKHYTV